MERINKYFIESLKETFNTKKVNIVCGNEGVGKTTGITMLSEDLGIRLIHIDTKVNDIREFQEFAEQSKCVEFIYVIKDANKMSVNSQNALLKILEEPTPNMHVYLLATSISGFIETILRRVERVVYVRRCNKSDLQLYDKLNFERLQSDFGDTIIDSLASFKDFNDLLTTDKSIVPFCNKVINNIRQVSTPNAFKISNSIKLTDNQDGYDLGVFLKILNTLSIDTFRKTLSRDALRVFTTSATAIKRFESGLVSNKAVVDLFIVEARSDIKGIE